MNDWFKLQKYIKIVYDRHLKPFLMSMLSNDYRCDLNSVDQIWSTVQNFDTFSCYFLFSVIFYGNRLIRMYSVDKFAAEKPMIERL